MNPEQNSLLTDLESHNWGTMMPVMLMIGAEVVSLRARGNCAIKPADLALFEAQVGDVDDFRGRLRSVFVQKINDVLGEASQGKTSLDEMKKDWAALESNLKSRVGEALEPLGLAVQQLKIEAIEAV